MLKYYKKLDPIEFKYKKILYENKDKIDYEENLNYRIKLRKYEASQQFAELTKKSFWDLQKNLDIAYSDSEQTDLFLEMYDIFYDKIINQYINIDGIERLFSEKYADFEWEMHLGINYKKHEMSYYRDHFIHQLKDTFMMSILLDEEYGDFYSKIKDVLMDEGNSKISRLVCKYLQMQMDLQMERSFYKDEKNSIKPSCEIIREHYLYNIIYMSCYMAGIFHDIGYPTAANMQENRRIIDYIVESYHFEGGNFDFNQVMILLQNSLLFRVVRAEEIRMRIEGDNVNHGTISALLFLLHFYENGAIYRLEPYKLCAVELAGLAIYNHTNKYSYQEKEETEYARCVFSLNPISYLLRICDDLQEWGRIYFEVLNKPNLLLCNTCHMPIIRRKKESQQKNYYYVCDCKSNVLFEPVFEYNQFPNRRLYNITVCTSMEIISKNQKDYIFKLNYDLARLLNIAYLDPYYAQNIIKELSKVKKLFPRQDKLGIIYVDYFVTANIILIKSAIVERYLFQHGKEDDMFKVIDKVIDKIKAGTPYTGENEEAEEKVKSKAGEIANLLLNEVSDNLIESIKKIFPDDIEKVTNYLEKAFIIYIYIALLMKLGRKLNCSILEKDIEFNQEEFFVKLIAQLNKNEEIEKFLDTKEVRILLKDCGIQAARLYENLNTYTYYPDSYFETFKPKEDSLYFAAEFFGQIGNYRLKTEDSRTKNVVLDAFTDLYCIQKMLRDIPKS